MILLKFLLNIDCFYLSRYLVIRFSTTFIFERELLRGTGQGGTFLNFDEIWRYRVNYLRSLNDPSLFLSGFLAVA